MLNWIVGSSLKFRYLVLALAAAMIYFGYGQLREMPVDVFPEFAPPLVEIQTPCLGLSPEEVEQLVTIPLEEALNGVEGLDVMRSKSVPQLSQVKLIFQPGTDLVTSRQLVQERVSMATPGLPTWAAPPVMLPPLSATSRCMKIGISSDTHSLIDLSMITYWTIRQRLMQVPGVANVAIWGERIEMPQIQVDPERMAKHKVTLDEVMEATADTLDSGMLKYTNGHHIGTGGWIETPNQRMPIRCILPIAQKSGEVSAAPFGEIVVRVDDGKQILLKDVADVVIGHQPMIGDGIVNDGPGLLLIVEKFPWGNTLQVTQGVEEALNALRPGLPGVEIDHTIFRPATFIETSLGNLRTALIIACVLVVLVLIAFLYEWRVALISCTAIPLSLMAGAMVLYLRGTTINTMVLAGFVIALGAVVDDAIVDIENIVRRLREARRNHSRKTMFQIVLDASIEVRHAIIFSTLIEVMALVPVFFMDGLSGAFFKPLALSYALAITASTVVALTVTPVMGFLLLRGSTLEHRDSPLVRWMQGIYNSLLARIMTAPAYAYSTVTAILLVGLIVTPLTSRELLPDFKERDFLMHWLTTPGTSWPEMNRITIQGSKEIREIDGVRNFGAHIGQALIMDEVVGMYFGENWISVDPSVDYDETFAKIEDVVKGYPLKKTDLQTYLKERIREVLTGTSEAIVVRIYGNDLQTLRDKAAEVSDSLKGIEGVIGLNIEVQDEIPHIQVKVDLEKAYAYGLKPGDVRRAAATMIAGEEVGDIHIGNRTYDVNVWSIPSARNSVNDLEDLLIDTPKRGKVRMADVADITILPTPSVIVHENLKRKLDVKLNVRGRSLPAVNADVEKALAGVTFPSEYSTEILGENAERQKASMRMLIWSTLAVVVIFFLLQTSFGSWRLAVIAFLTLPAAMVGGVLAAYAGGGVISLGSLVGFLTVLGISARNGILMINHFQHLQEEEGMEFGIDLVKRGASERLAPIMMTATTTGLALIPLVIAGAIPGNEIEHPMAIVILGGLVTATLLNLFVIPSLYLRFGNRTAVATA